MNPKPLVLPLLLAGAALLPAQSATYDDVIIYVGYGGTPPVDSVPLARVVDANRDGLGQPGAELFAFQRKIFSAAYGRNFITGLAVTAEAGRLAFYSANSCGSVANGYTVPEGALFRAVDLDGNGRIDDTEAAVWADFPQPTGSGYTPHAVALGRDGTGRTVAYAVCNATGVRGVWRAVDANQDGDARDPGENVVWADKAAGLTVSATAGPVGLGLDWLLKGTGNPQGGAAVWNSGSTTTPNPDAFAWIALQEDAQGKPTARAFLCPSALSKLDRNPDFVSGKLVDVDITWQSGANTYNYCDLLFAAVSPGGFKGRDAWYFATGYGAARTYGDKNRASQQVSGLVFRGVDNNSDGDLNDQGEVNLLYNGSGNALPGGLIVGQVSPPTYYDNISSSNTTRCDYIYGISVVGETVYVVHAGTGGSTSAKSVLRMRDANSNFVIDSGEVDQVFWAVSPWAPIWSAQFGPYINGILAVPAWSLADPQPAGSQPYGTGCIGSSGFRPLAWGRGGAPALGNAAFELVLSAGRPGGAALLLLGGSAAAWPGVGPLPLPLDFLGATGCLLHTSVTLALPALLDPAGVGRSGLPVPGDPALLGASLYGQYLAVDPGANGAGFTTTGGVKITVQ